MVRRYEEESFGGGNHGTLERTAGTTFLAPMVMHPNLGVQDLLALLWCLKSHANEYRSRHLEIDGCWHCRSSLIWENDDLRRQIFGCRQRLINRCLRGRVSDITYIRC